MCITEVVVPDGSIRVQHSQGFTDVQAQFASQGRHKVSIRNESRVSFRDASRCAHQVLIFIVRKYQRTLRGMPVDWAIWQRRTYAPRTSLSLRSEVLNRKDREEHWKKRPRTVCYIRFAGMRSDACLDLSKSALDDNPRFNGRRFLPPLHRPAEWGCCPARDRRGGMRRTSGSRRFPSAPGASCTPGKPRYRVILAKSCWHFTPELGMKLLVPSC